MNFAIVPVVTPEMLSHSVTGKAHKRSGKILVYSTRNSEHNWGQHHGAVCTSGREANSSYVRKQGNEGRNRFFHGQRNGKLIKRTEANASMSVAHLSQF